MFHMAPALQAAINLTMPLILSAHRKMLETAFYFNSLQVTLNRWWKGYSCFILSLIYVIDLIEHYFGSIELLIFITELDGFWYMWNLVILVWMFLLIHSTHVLSFVDLCKLGLIYNYDSKPWGKQKRTTLKHCHCWTEKIDTLVISSRERQWIKRRIYWNPTCDLGTQSSGWSRNNRIMR